ncbi:MAG: hypothetical protein J7J46_08190 [Candidatus Desulfofervidus sp.]|nr:hypothetical protein [Candidatus Desulfofervidus sp.]
MGGEYPRFSDFAEEEAPLEGKKRKIEEILNIEILVTGFRIGKSKYKDKDYLTLQFENGNKKYIVFTGSEVLLKQAQKYADKIPFYTTIRKVNSYYTMT